MTRVAEWDRPGARSPHERGLLLLEAMKVMCFPAMRALLQRLAACCRRPDSLRAAFGSVHRPGSASCSIRPWTAAPPGMWGSIRSGSMPSSVSGWGLRPSAPEVALDRAAGGGGSKRPALSFRRPASRPSLAPPSSRISTGRCLALGARRGPWSIEGKWWNPQHIALAWGIRSLPAWPHGHLRCRCRGGGMQHEADHFADCLRQTRLAATPPGCPRP